jgi:hypothetical protein
MQITKKSKTNTIEQNTSVKPKKKTMAKAKNLKSTVLNPKKTTQKQSLLAEKTSIEKKIKSMLIAIEKVIRSHLILKNKGK